jgi:hypothetical protein
MAASKLDDAMVVDDSFALLNDENRERSAFSTLLSTAGPSGSSVEVPKGQCLTGMHGPWYYGIFSSLIGRDVSGGCALQRSLTMWRYLWKDGS